VTGHTDQPRPPDAATPPDERPLHFDTADGLRLTGAVWGEGAREVVFSPGNGFPVQTYRAALQALAEAATVYALNPRGQGGSPVPQPYPGWEAQWGDLAAFVERTRRTPAILLGHSLGSMLSLWVAAHRPELVHGLILCDPLVTWLPGDPRLYELTDMQRELIARTEARTAHWPDREAAHADLRGRGSYAAWADEPFAAFVAHGLADAPDGGVTLACPPWYEASSYRARPTYDHWAWVEHIRCPVVVVRGKESPVCRTEAVEELVGRVPVGSVLTAPGHHTFLQEHPRRAGQTVAVALDILIRSGPDGRMRL